MTNLDSIWKSRDITLPAKVPVVKAMVFPVVMCGCDSWTIKKAERQRIDAFKLWCWRRLLRVPWLKGDQTHWLRSPLVNPKGKKPRVLDAEAEAPILWPPDAKNQKDSDGKDPDAEKDWRQEEKKVTEDEMVGWHHRRNGHESEQALGGGEGQGSLAFIGSQRVGHDLVADKQQLSPAP